MVVEYYEPASVAGQGSFVLFRVTQGYKSLQNYLKSFGQAGGCINNINCPQYAAFALQKQAVVCIVVNGGELCSGALVNNTRNDGTRIFLLPTTATPPTTKPPGFFALTGRRRDAQIQLSNPPLPNPFPGVLL